MSLSEFDIIARYFSAGFPQRKDVLLGVGDDGAVLAVPEGQRLVLACDTLVAGRHFHADTDPAALGHKALAVNLSDLAAMGAAPAWFTLALTLPAADADWLQGFAGGLAALAAEFDVALVGGDTTRGPLCMSVTVAGLVPPEGVLGRAGARAGDAIVITGPLGGAALGLALLEESLPGMPPAPDAAGLDAALACLHRPRPRVTAGLALRGQVHAAIDISDGLLGDLAHILEAGGVGARLDVDRVPCHPALAQQVADEDLRRRLALAGGEDYELCLAVAPDRLQRSCADLRAVGCQPAVIGTIEAEPGLRLVDAAGRPVTLALDGFQHFR